MPRKLKPQSATKLELAKLINTQLASLGLSQATAAEILGLKQPKISALVNYSLEGISVEKLLELLTLLNTDIEIRVRPASVKGRIHVSAA